jgi:hypothetical protein
MELMLSDDLKTVSAIDLTLEAETLEAQGVSYEFHALTTEDANGFMVRAGEMMFVPSAGRAGICLGADSQWTDASSAEDAVCRYNEDEMVN